MVNPPVLSLLIFLPMVCGLFILMIKGDDDIKAMNSRNVAFFANALVISGCLYLFFIFNNQETGYQLIEELSTSFFRNSFYKVGIDNLSLIILYLSSFVFLFILITNKDSKTQTKQYMATILFAQASVNGALLSIDILMFYIFLEIIGLCLLFLLGTVGDEKNKVHALKKSLAYMATSSLLILSAIIYIYPNIQMIDNMDYSIYSFEQQTFIWMLLFIGFALRLPLFPFHRWHILLNNSLTNHVSILVMGILINISIYGMIKLVILPMPQLSLAFSPYIIGILCFSIFYFGISNFYQNNLKEIISYNSIIQISIALLGIFSFTESGFFGLLLIIISQAITAISFLYCMEIMKTRNISYNLKELSISDSLFAGLNPFVIIFMISAIGAPLSIGFIGNFMVFTGLFERYQFISIFALIAIIIVPICFLNTYRKVIKEKQTLPEDEDTTPLSFFEKFVLSLMAIITISLGIFPWIITDIAQNSYIITEALG